jgi:hypothetical protein
MYLIPFATMSAQLGPLIASALTGSTAGNRLGQPDVTPAAHFAPPSGFRENMMWPRYSRLSTMHEGGTDLLANDNICARNPAAREMQFHVMVKE